MRRMRCASALLCIALAARASTALAHHSVLPFDGAHGTTIAGTVARVLWQNPHVLIALDVPNQAGAIERWTVESEAPRVLTRLGWMQDSVTAGRRITVPGARARDGSHALRCKSVQLADGRTLSCFPADAP